MIHEPLQITADLCPASLTDSALHPATVTDRHWKTVTWLASTTSKSGHEIADGTGLGLFNSGALTPGTPFSYTFFASGTYTVIDPSPLATQTIKVPMNASFPTGAASTTFALHWAAKTAPFSYVYDVQVKPPNATKFTPLATGVSTDSTTFTPPQKPGTYQFRARLRNTATNSASAWSPPCQVSINP